MTLSAVGIILDALIGELMLAAIVIVLAVPCGILCAFLSRKISRQTNVFQRRKIFGTKYTVVSQTLCALSAVAACAALACLLAFGFGVSWDSDWLILGLIGCFVSVYMIAQLVVQWHRTIKLKRAADSVSEAKNTSV